MQQITDIDANPKQRFKIQLENKKTIEFELEFKPNQQGWYLNVAYENFKTNGLRLTFNPNLLSAYQNLIPFGLMCDVADGSEPYFLDDFKNERASLYVLNANEVGYVHEVLYGKI